MASNNWKETAIFCHVETNYGYLYYRWGTGDNVEITHLKVDEPYRGNGYGTELIVLLLQELQEIPPYATVFGFTRWENLEARLFYRSVGFGLSLVSGVYADGKCVLFSAHYDHLKEVHGLP